jgi:hypothetical protein
MWQVPAVTGDTSQGTGEDFSTLWVGIDGDGLADLVQAGTEQDAITISFPFFGGITFQFSNFYAWIEFLPTQTTEQVISNFSVSPGDIVWVTVTVLSLLSPPVGTLTAGFFQLENISTGQSTAPIAIAPTSVGATEAEWIMERPTVNGSLPELANYGSALMPVVYAKTGGGQTVLPFPEDPSTLLITMTNFANNVLSTASTAGPLVSFTWKAFD